jgi:hypothetical protein
VRSSRIAGQAGIAGGPTPPVSTGLGGDAQVAGQDVLGGQPYLLLLAAILVASVRFGGGILDRGLFLGWRVGHTQVGADHIRYGLAVFDGAVRQAFQGVQASQPHRGLVGAELVGGLGVQLGDASFGGVTVGMHQGQLGVTLPSGGQPQCHRPPGAPRGSLRCGSRRAGIAPPARHNGATARTRSPPRRTHEDEHNQRPRPDDPFRQRWRGRIRSAAACGHTRIIAQDRKSSQSLVV